MKAMKKQQKNDEKEQDNIEYGEVVDRPPEFTVLPKLSKVHLCCF
jgi:hypothetical protein